MKKVHIMLLVLGIVGLTGFGIMKFNIKTTVEDKRIDQRMGERLASRHEREENPYALLGDKLTDKLTYYNINKPISYITKEIEEILFEKWLVMDSDIGYSLKYNITGGQLFDAELDISKEVYNEITMVANKQYLDRYPSPIFVYYQETMAEMAEDELLNYTGIEDVNPETVGTVILVFSYDEYSTDERRFNQTKFMLIEDYVIAIHEHTFYQLNRTTE